MPRPKKAAFSKQLCLSEPYSLLVGFLFNTDYLLRIMREGSAALLEPVATEPPPPIKCAPTSNRLGGALAGKKNLLYGLGPNPVAGENCLHFSIFGQNS